MGNRIWAILAMRLQAVHVGGEVFYKFVSTPLQWYHITQPTEWHVVPHVGVRHEGVAPLPFQIVTYINGKNARERVIGS